MKNNEMLELVNVLESTLDDLEDYKKQIDELHTDYHTTYDEICSIWAKMRELVLEEIDKPSPHVPKPKGVYPNYCLNCNCDSFENVTNTKIRCTNCLEEYILCVSANTYRVPCFSYNTDGSRHESCDGFFYNHSGICDTCGRSYPRSKILPEYCAHKKLTKDFSHYNCTTCVKEFQLGVQTRITTKDFTKCPCNNVDFLYQNDIGYMKNMCTSSGDKISYTCKKCGSIFLVVKNETA